jgi:anti-anti-sigma factor
MSKTMTTPRTLELQGSLDAEAMGHLRQLFEELASHGGDLVLDFSSVDHMDSAGLGGIAFLYKRLLMAGHEFSLQNVNGQPLTLIEQLSLTGKLMRAPHRPKAAAKPHFVEQAA